jgi:hypothetical protein
VGTSVGRGISLMLSKYSSSGLSPPWQQKIFPSMMAATGKQLKQSVKVFHSFTLYRRLPRGLMNFVLKIYYIRKQNDFRYLLQYKFGLNGAPNYVSPYKTILFQVESIKRAQT